MRNEEDVHSSEQALLLYADGELSSRDAARIRTHLAACWACRARMAEIEATIAGFIRAHREAYTPTSDIAGPRSLLKAHLAELARSSGRGRWSHLRIALGARGLAYACALAFLVMLAARIAYQHAARDGFGNRASVSSEPLPNPRLTPGSTRHVTVADLCSMDHDEVVRAVPASLQKRVFHEYSMRGAPAVDYEVDFLITPGLGGSDDVRNLWPEPHYNTVWNSYVKDQLEDHLHHMVCDGQVGLGQAQKDIAANWISAYKKYFHTDQPLPEPSTSNLPLTSRWGVASRERGLRHPRLLQACFSLFS